MNNSELNAAEIRNPVENPSLPAEQVKPVTQSKRRAFDIFFFSVIGLLVGFIFGFVLANHWNKQALRPPGLANQAASEGQLPEGHPAAGQQQMEAIRAQIEMLKKRASENPRDFEARAQLGNLYYDAAKYEQAVEWYQKALDVNPKSAETRTDMATAYHFLNQHDKAIEELQKTLSNNPNFPNALRNLGMIKLAGKKDVKGALEVWERLVQTNPTHPQIEQVKEWIKQLKEGKNILQQ